jgi:hypothetical protein
MSEFDVDLTKRPPRSPRVRLGGYVHLPRMLDKCRAVLAGKNGEYNYNCPMDEEFLEFTGITATDLKAQVALGKGDGEILEWINAQAPNKPSAAAIAHWSHFQEQKAPVDLEMREFYQEEHRRLAPHRTDLATWFDLLDLDDYVTFGGAP